jgi:predicted CoA-binding protein
VDRQRRKDLVSDSTVVADAAHKRLDRIEEKIDKLTDFMIAIARIEEKQMAIESDVKVLWTKVHDADEKADKLETIARANEVKVVIISRVFWAIVIAIVVAGISIQGQITSIHG